MLDLYNKAFYFIAGHGRGWAFSSSDLMQKFTRQQADNILSDLVKRKKIRRICRGMYDYPKYSELLEQLLSPDIEQVARAFSRKFNWKIEISGDSALNILGLSTQIEAKYIYLSNGSNRIYNVFDTTLEFKKSSLKDIGFKHKESSLIVQALKTLGQDRINDKVINDIRNKIESSKYKKILSDTKTTTVWIYETIKQICKEDINE
ncbi:MAG: hypothetical protein ACI81I_001178 [Arcobacteraceae bacterium]